MKLIDSQTQNLIPLNSLTKSDEDNDEKFRTLYEKTKSKLLQMAFKVCFITVGSENLESKSRT
jgi:hypothetical protein